jgi:hypothetical protein
VYLL